MDFSLNKIYLLPKCTDFKVLKDSKGINKIPQSRRKNSFCAKDLRPKYKVLKRDKSEKLEVLGLECPPPPLRLDNLAKNEHTTAFNIAVIEANLFTFSLIC